MKQAPREIRREAARAFMESLNALENRLSSEPGESTRPASTKPVQPTSSPQVNDIPILAKEFEEAVADIEQNSQS
ncbi:MULTISPECIES: hypothetical protein [unclassified Leptolyngbya]|uniref:hypothetical protein n=1 Tax=unclassified Leptolyngbya TaxID=2650499 RepID=UPI00168767FE|nr:MULTISPECIES: hypothetical protein [unclassified Leptolyngbya]MBD1910583.1 hypothetical protein [Leptolyngbya sp. FACHB-8]MBD2155188.1 hypothetical protein [Leptolyngbya sp. FACHB-16]